MAQNFSPIKSNLFGELKKNISGEIHYDKFSRQLYSTDASSYQIEPAGVVCPATMGDVVKTIRIAAQNNTSVIMRGGGTSLSGQGIGEGVILDVSRHLNRILEINPEEKWARVQTGVLLEQLNNALTPHKLMVGPDPSSAPAATIGGMTANNSTGAHSILYGMMIDHVLEVDVVLSDGSIVTFQPYSRADIFALARQATLEGRLYEKIPQLLTKYENLIRNNYPKTWRNVAGYNLNRLLKGNEAGKPFNLAPLIVGSEGTLGAILSVKVNLVEKPTCSHLVLLHFDSLHHALSNVEQILEHRPGAVELLDDFFIGLTRQNAQYRNRLNFLRGKPAAVLIVEFSGEDKALLHKQMDNLITTLRRNGFKGEIVEQTAPEDIANVWRVRKAGLGLLLSKRGDAKPLAFIDDTAVPLCHLADYADKVTEICRQAGTEAAFYAHASAGCLHINPMINLKTESGIRQMQTISKEVIQLAIEYGGTSTGEHGEGLARSYYNEKVYGPDLHRAFRELKGIFDPGNLFNPGKIVDSPLPWDSRILRFNPQYSTPQTISKTILDFSAEGGFGGMVEMCNGQGFCRKVGSGVMCPSYMATGDEAFSTRGRANALRAAITGNLGKQGLENKSLYHTLELCLACKACKHECPSLVDMAKLKYEYLAYYQKQHGVPFRSRLFAHISDFNRFGSKRPKIANILSGNKIVRRMLDSWLGIDSRRSLPGLTTETFQAWFSQHPPNENAPAGEVILWDDTFMSYNEPETGKASVAVLEAAGYRVLVMENRRCCGRPMISKGFLEKAKENAIYNLNLLLPYAEKGIPIIGVEPGCNTMFRDEYIDLVNNEAARKVAENVFFIEEFLSGLAEKGRLNLSWKETIQPRKILVHGHCYQKAVTGMESVLKILQLIPGTSIEEIDSGCCGMAGAFGYEKEHYHISMKCGEERLFPAVRAAGADTEIAAAGTSCRHQIFDGTGRIAQHPIVLFARALAGE